MDVILGPPGCGKTHRLIEEVKREIEAGTPPERIGFASFTKKAVEEALTRICTEFGLSKKRFPFVRTLHSMCFLALGLQRSDVMGPSDWKRFGDEMGFDMIGTSRNAMDDGLVLPGSTREGDRYLMAIERARLRCVPIEQEVNEARQEELHLPLLHKMQKLMFEYLHQEGRFTFTDMLDQFLAVGEAPNLKLLIIDEAQDLTPLQWKVVFKLARSADHVIVAGDDDQAIHRWAGVEPRQFTHIAKHAEVLGQSYRLPRPVFDFSQNIVHRIPGRVQKPYVPAAHDGSVMWHSDVHSVPLGEGSWTFMARTNAQVASWAAEMREQGYLFEVNGYSSVRKRTARALRLWGIIQRGGYLTHSEAMALYDELPKQGEARAFEEDAPVRLKMADPDDKYTYEILYNDYGLLLKQDTHPLVALDLSVEDKRYVAALQRRGENLEAPPRIKLSTIHSMKGGEDDNIVLDLATTRRIEESDHPEDEHRVFYVGVTRAKHNLHVLQTGARYSYGI